MKEIIQRFPPISLACCIDIFTVFLAGQKISCKSNIADIHAMCYVGHDIQIIITYFSKSWLVYAQMNRLLVKKEYIIVFVYTFTTKINNTIRITAPKGIAHEHPCAWPVISDPRPKSVVVNFIYSKHV